MYPVPTHRKVTADYGARGAAWSGGKHRGVDFGGAGIRGQKVYAPWGGKVIGIGTWGPAYGDRSPVIDFDPLPDGSPGLWGVIAHLETVAVKVGQRVNAGDFLGTVGERGNATGPHVHFEVQAAATWSGPAAKRERDPWPWIQAMPLKQQGRVYESQMQSGAANSNSVFNLQVALRQAGYVASDVFTAFYGVRTIAAVQAFKIANNIQPTTGVADEATVKALGLTWVPRATVSVPPEAPKVPVVVQPPASEVPAAVPFLFWSDYTGKLTDPVTFKPDPDKWYLIPMKRPLKPVPASGHESHMLYARLGFDWDGSGDGAKVECKFVRGDGDATAYDERHYFYGTKSVPFQQTHFEEGEKGLAGAWWMKFHGGVSRVTVTTRYAKTHVVAGGE